VRSTVSGQIRSHQDKSGQVKSRQTRSSQIKLNQVKQGCKLEKHEQNEASVILLLFIKNQFANTGSVKYVVN
jgi:hypothetical protein